MIRIRWLFVATMLDLALARPAGAEVVLTQLVGDLLDPVAITHAGDQSSRLFVTLQAGQIVIIKSGALLPTPFLDVSNLVSTGGERGLFSVAFHPDSVRKGFFFVNYTDGDGNVALARYQVPTGTPDVADPDSALVLRTVPHPGADNHNGGQVVFGPDGFLYWGIGDGGGGGDEPNNAQNLRKRLGKILRLDVDHPQAPLSYAIPPTNPFVNTPNAKREIWAFGLRNPWRMNFDRLKGALFIGDVGQGEFEEVDLQPASSPGGQNYGWRRKEGNHCFNPASGCEIAGLTNPIVEYKHEGGRCSITGGFRYRGREVPSLYGRYVFADFCSGEIFTSSRGPSGIWSMQLLEDTDFFISSFGEDEGGELFLADHAGSGIYRFRDTSPPPSPSFRESFNDGDASDWTVLDGNWLVARGRLIGEGAGTALAPFAGCGACTVEADIRPRSPGAKARLIGWRQDAQNLVEAIFNTATGKVKLRQVIGGVVAAQKSVSQPLSPGKGYHAAIRLAGSTLELSLDGAPLLSVSAQGNPNGAAGFGASGTASFDDLVVAPNK